MKKFTLSADFIKWNSRDENSTEADSFGYVIDLESEEEARIRLDSLIIERMSSKPGWSYKLINSGLAEFPISDEKDFEKIIYDLPVLTSKKGAAEINLGHQIDLSDLTLPSETELLDESGQTESPSL